MKVATIVGARPQFIKAAALSRSLRALPDTTELLIHTGQHFDQGMSQVFFDEMDLSAPDINLGVGSGRHGAQTGKMLADIEEVLLQHQPDWVLVYGDTNSTLAGALAAAKLNLRVAHVEAGLRSFNRRMPEELNRVVTDHLAALNFAPTEKAVSNLVAEGIPESRIKRVGDVMLDVARYYEPRAKHTTLQGLGVASGGYILATVHRADSTDNAGNLKILLQALEMMSRRMPVVLPLHPRTRVALKQHGLSIGSPELKIIDPVGYFEMLALEKHAALIATDSGGVQKEAFFFSVPCLTLREETEWTELVDLGWNRLCGPSNGADAIAAAALSFVGQRGADASPYGDGNAAGTIAQTLLDQTRW